MTSLRLNRTVPFDLGVTLCCGQVFRWKLQSGWWYGVVGNTVWKMKQNHSTLEYENAKESEVLEYFGLHDELPQILKEISKDSHVREAVAAFRGLRILRQEPWECLISYICATHKGIPSIKRMLDQISMTYGERIVFEGEEFYSFPKVERLAEASKYALARCGLGYRVRYVKETAEIIRQRAFDLDSLRRMRYDRAKEELLKLSGVGPKVADCVLLFSMGKTEAFPIDVWMKRVILRHYTKHIPQRCIERLSEGRTISNSEYAVLNLFGRNYFGDHAGYAQEYLYHYERTRAQKHT